MWWCKELRMSLTEWRVGRDMPTLAVEWSILCSFAGNEHFHQNCKVKRRNAKHFCDGRSADGAQSLQTLQWPNWSRVTNLPEPTTWSLCHAHAPAEHTDTWILYHCNWMYHGLLLRPHQNRSEVYIIRQLILNAVGPISISYSHL